MSELRLLFWNMRRQPEAVPCAIELCAEHRPHLLITAEAPAAFLATLRRHHVHARSPSTVERVVTINLAPTELRMRAVRASVDAEAFELRIGDDLPHLLVAVHLESGLWQRSENDRGLVAERARRFIESAELDVGHDQTIVIGDFNMDPFSPSMVDVRGLNAMITRGVGRRGQRTSGGYTSKTFFNPMWRLLGAASPPASYWWRNTGANGYYWHMLDQVLLREAVGNEQLDVRVLTATPTRALISERAGRPIREISDHLPLFVRLDLAPRATHD
jgi:endonuclease/exonuclease/phosphatase family metal-dependent hydrolase